MNASVGSLSDALTAMQQQQAADRTNLPNAIQQAVAAALHAMSAPATVGQTVPLSAMPSSSAMPAALHAGQPPLPHLANLPKPPKPDRFDGKAAGLANWLHQMEAFLCAHAGNLTSSPAGVTLAVAFLSGSALTWWRSYSADLAARGLPIPNWATWCNDIKQAFAPLNAAKLARAKLVGIKQTGSVPSYVNTLLTLFLDVPTMSDDDKLFTFLQGLKQTVRLHVEATSPTNLADAIQVAADVDHCLYFVTRGERSLNSKDYKKDNNYKKNNRDNKPAYRAVAASSSGPTPMEVNVLGNGPRLSKLTDKEREACRQKGLCFKCRKHGHLAQECPTGTGSGKGR